MSMREWRNISAAKTAVSSPFFLTAFEIVITILFVDTSIYGEEITASSLFSALMYHSRVVGS